MKKLILMQGLPGSGKSIMAKNIQANTDGDCDIISTDDFFVTDGKYRFDGSFIGVAHEWNRSRVIKKMFDNDNNEKDVTIIIDNTNTTLKEMTPYIYLADKHGYKVSVRKPNTAWCDDASECFKRGSHDVPLFVIENMKRRMENYESGLDQNE